MKYPIAIVAALALAGCCGANNAPATVTPYAAPKVDPCIKPEAAPKANPLGCNQPATASTGSPMSTVAMPTPLAKMAVVPPNVILCVINGVRCVLDTLVSPLKP